MYMFMHVCMYVNMYVYLYVRNFFIEGEKKRASIGIELINEQSVLILDEPTSGMYMYVCMYKNEKKGCEKKNLNYFEPNMSKN